MKQILSTEGLVLHKDPSGEHYWRYTLFSKEYGKLLSLQRATKKSNTHTTPDLFDLGEFEIEVPGQGSATFIREFKLHHRFSNIGKSYHRLQCASRFAHTVSQNLQHAEHFDKIYSLCCKTFKALEDAPHPDATLIKSFYIFAKDEGYPIKEDWYTHLPPFLQHDATMIIKTPLVDLQLSPAEINNVLENLCIWLQSHTDIDMG